MICATGWYFSREHYDNEKSHHADGILPSGRRGATQYRAALCQAGRHPAAVARALSRAPQAGSLERPYAQGYGRLPRRSRLRGDEAILARISRYDFAMAAFARDAARAAPRAMDV